MVRVFQILAVGLGAVCLADAAHSQQSPVFKSGVELASLDVTVTDDKGRPIDGLRPDEFIVTIGDQKVPVELLQFLRVGEQSSVQAGTPGAANSPGRTLPPPFRVIVFLIDDVSMPARPLRQVMQPALEMLEMLAPNDLVGVVTTSGLGPVVNPTRDRSAVKAALLNKDMTGRLLRRTGRFVIAAQEAIEIDKGAPGALDTLADRECLIPDIPVKRKDPICEAALETSARDMARADMYRSLQQLESLERVVTALRGGPSPKIIVVLSSGLVLRPGQPELARRLDSLSRVAASAGAVIYGLGEAPAFVSMTETMEQTRAIREEAVFLNDGLHTAVGATGGQSFLVIGQPKRFVQRILSETSAFYRLGVRIPPEARTGSMRVQVTTTRRGATARTNRHVIPPAGG